MKEGSEEVEKSIGSEREISRINVLIYRLRVPAKKIYRLRGKTKAFDIILIKKI